jgi:poly(A) polymerase Pap1
MSGSASSANLNNNNNNKSLVDNKNTVRSYGVSMPLSVEFPTLKDKELTEKLEEALKKYSVFETDSELRHRMDVLHKINTLFKGWIKDISVSKVSRNFFSIIN